MYVSTLNILTVTNHPPISKAHLYVFSTHFSTPQGIFIVTASPERWPTKAKEAPSPHEVRLTPLDTNSVFQKILTVINNQPISKAFFHQQLTFFQSLRCKGYKGLAVYGSWVS